MRTRHEQMQAYRFVTRRLVSSMLSGEPETTELPMRRLGLALFGGAIVAAIVLAVIGIYGFVRPMGGKPQENDIIIMRETGARFVYIQGRLHPVLNFTSAQLIVGAGGKGARTMSRRSLERVPRGQTLGIQGAPDPVPPKKSLLGLPWSVCVTGSASAAAVRTEVRVGETPPGGADLGTDALLVTTGTGFQTPGYLLLDGFRLRVPDRTVLAALELTSVNPARVSSAFLNSVPAGPDLAPPVLARAGTVSARPVSGQPSVVGQVYRGGRQYYVMTRGGLAPIGEVTAALLMAAGGHARDISAKQAADALSNEQVEPDGFPKDRPKVLPGGGVDLCATYGTSAATGNAARTGRTVTIERFPAGSTQAEPGDQAPPGQGGGSTADRVVVAQGRGMLVRALPAPGVTAETVPHLITDQGLSFALGTSDQLNAKDALGYAEVDPIAVPAAMLALVPEGPALDPAAARRFLPVAGTVTTSPPSPAAPYPPSRSPSKSPAARPSVSRPSSQHPSTSHPSIARSVKPTHRPSTARSNPTGG